MDHPAARQRMQGPGKCPPMRNGKHGPTSGRHPPPAGLPLAAQTAAVVQGGEGMVSSNDEGGDGAAGRVLGGVGSVCTLGC